MRFASDLVARDGDIDEMNRERLPCLPRETNFESVNFFEDLRRRYEGCQVHEKGSINCVMMGEEEVEDVRMEKSKERVNFRRPIAFPAFSVQPPGTEKVGLAND